MINYRQVKLSKILIFFIVFMFYGCLPKSNLNFYVPNISRENLIRDLKSSGLKLNEKLNGKIEVEDLNNQIKNIEISIGDYSEENKTVEVELISISYNNEKGKLSLDKLSEEEKDEFKEIFSNEVLPYIVRIE